MSYSDEFVRELTLKWAPINYQYINLKKNNNIFSSLSGIFGTRRGKYYYAKQDLIVPINLEYYNKNNLDHEKCYSTKDIRNRLDELKVEELTPVAYYSFAATKNHFYLLYSFYHADDTTHPNDMEGCLIILERNNEEQKLLGMVTIAHGKRPKYAFDDNLLLNEPGHPKPRKLFVEYETKESKNDNPIVELHPLIQQESGKHGMYGLGYPWILTQIWRWLKNIFGFKSDIIVYFPYQSAQPYSIEDLIRYQGTTHYATFYYDLVDLMQNQGFYHRRIGKNKENSTFNKNEKFHGNAANPPWLWEYDGIMLWDDPALLAEKWFVQKKGGKRFRDEPNSEKINYEQKMSK